MKLDPSGDRSLYLQLADVLRAKIEAGEYRPGQKIPSESQLIGEYEVGRNTARGALAELRKEGLIVTLRRRGSIVRSDEEKTIVWVDKSARISARTPSSHERQEQGIPEGVSFLVVQRKGKPEELYRGDQTDVQFDD
ncbi:MAG: GntR family transcriptional regulator [Streptosporangiales bacterium]|nr:GntR family transcriptional regulator [Streptosporangiales bacterium]